MQWFAIVFALVAGAANPFQSGTNAALKQHLAQPVWATLWVYGSGFVAVLFFQAFARQPLPTAHTAAAVPWWAWTGGLISIVATVAGLTLAQKLGSGIFTSLSIASTVAVSILLDHFGLIGLNKHPATPLRLLGAGLMMVGVWMVSRF